MVRRGVVLGFGDVGRGRVGRVGSGEVSLQATWD